MQAYIANILQGLGQGIGLWQQPAPPLPLPALPTPTPPQIGDQFTSPCRARPCRLSHVVRLFVREERSSRALSAIGRVSQDVHRCVASFLFPQDYQEFLRVPSDETHIYVTARLYSDIIRYLECLRLSPQRLRAIQPSPHFQVLLRENPQELLSCFREPETVRELRDRQWIQLNVTNAHHCTVRTARDCRDVALCRLRESFQSCHVVLGHCVIEGRPYNILATHQRYGKIHIVLHPEDQPFSEGWDRNAHFTLTPLWNRDPSEGRRAFFNWYSEDYIDPLAEDVTDEFAFEVGLELRDHTRDPQGSNRSRDLTLMRVLAEIFHKHAPDVQQLRIHSKRDDALVLAGSGLLQDASIAASLGLDREHSACLALEEHRSHADTLFPPYRDFSAFTACVLRRPDPSLARRPLDYITSLEEARFYMPGSEEEKSLLELVEERPLLSRCPDIPCFWLREPPHHRSRHRFSLAVRCLRLQQNLNQNLCRQVQSWLREKDLLK